MAIQQTRWSPDTCSSPSCIVDYIWDDTLSPDKRVHSLLSFVQKCALHALLDDATAYTAITDENPRKNIVLGLLAVNAPELFNITPNGPVPIPGAVVWSYDANRVLQISLPTVGIALTKTTLQTKLDTGVGIGKVVIS